MRHMKAGRTFNRDTNARKALFIGLAKNLIEKEQIKTTLPKAKDLRSVVEKLITRAKVDTVANRRLTASELGNSSAATVKKLFDVLGKRYANRPGGYTRVLKAGFRYGEPGGEHSSLQHHAHSLYARCLRKDRRDHYRYPRGDLRR